jgi:hypothetical protein
MSLLTFFDYLSYLVQSDNLHGIHSPFLYRFAEQVLYHKEDKRLESIEYQRSLMIKSQSKIEHMPLSYFVDRFTLPAKYCYILTKIMEYLPVSNFREYGLCTGIETNYALSTPLQNNFSYQYFYKNANRVKDKSNEFLNQTRVSNSIDLEDGTSYWDIHFVHLHSNASDLWDYYDQIKPQLNHRTIIIVSNIRYTYDHFLAWKQLSNQPEIGVDLDLFRMGLLFFRKEQPKESFLLRY